MINNPPANARDARDTGSIPGSGRSPGVGNGNSLQYSCLENSMDKRAWQAIVHGVAKSQTQLSMQAVHTCTDYRYFYLKCPSLGFLGSSAGGESPCNTGDPGSIPGSGSSPGEGNGYPLKYCCLGNPLDRGAWQAIVHGVAKSWK